MGEFAKIKLVITKKPKPPALDPFDCVLCEREIKRDPYNPEYERPPVCFRCTMHTPSRPQLAGVGIHDWQNFYRAHSLLCAIKQEIDRARNAH